MEAILIIIKEKVEAACAKAGITVEQLGLKLGMSTQAINNRLKTGKFAQEELERMATLMGCKYHSLFIFPDGTEVE